MSTEEERRLQWMSEPLECRLWPQETRDNVATILTRMADKVRKSHDGALAIRSSHSVPKRLDDNGDVVYGGNEEYVCRLVFERPVGAPVEESNDS